MYLYIELELKQLNRGLEINKVTEIITIHNTQECV